MKRPWLLLSAYALMSVVIFALAPFSVPEYSIVRHTTSELAAQGAPHAWIMRAIFVLLGAAAVIEGWPRLRSFHLHRALLLVFGLSLIGAAVWSHAPVDTTLAYDLREDQLHSWCASATGMSFTLFAIAWGFIEPRPLARGLAFAIAVLATLLSMLMFNVPAYMGLLQRAIFLSSFGWMLWVFYARELGDAPQPA